MFSLQKLTFFFCFASVPPACTLSVHGVISFRFRFFRNCFQEICKEWPSVTKADVENRLKAIFHPQLFSPSDIRDERRKLKELLEHCK